MTVSSPSQWALCPHCLKNAHFCCTLNCPCIRFTFRSKWWFGLWTHIFESRRARSCNFTWKKKLMAEVLFSWNHPFLKCSYLDYHICLEGGRREGFYQLVSNKLINVQRQFIHNPPSPPQIKAKALCYSPRVRIFFLQLCRAAFNFGLTSYEWFQGGYR